MSKPLLHFVHANSYPAGTYRRFLLPLCEHYRVDALEMHAHDPRYPVRDGWPELVAELAAQLEARYQEPVVLVGHSMGGMLSLMVAKARPELVRCVVMLDAPVVAGWRALFWRVLKNLPGADRYTPAKSSARRRMQWPDAAAAHQHFVGKPMFAVWAPGVLDDYIEHGMVPHPDGVQLRFTREAETAVYRGLPHHLGSLTRRPFPVPIGFIGGTESEENRQAGLGPTRRLVGAHFRLLPGSHLFPMESPEQAAAATLEMIASLLAA